MLKVKLGGEEPLEEVPFDGFASYMATYIASAKNTVVFDGWPYSFADL